MTDADKIYELVRWWEKRRWIYNLSMLFFVVVLFWDFFFANITEAPNWIYVDIVVFAALANLSYTLGWTIPVFIASWKKNTDQLGKHRKLLFGLGLLFSFGVAFMCTVAYALAHMFDDLLHD
jgi:hypothetical protein